MNHKKKTAIILSNMGGARTEQELKQFLINMFRDKRILPGFFRYFLAPVLRQFRYKSVWKTYESIGGTPIYKHTESLVIKLQKYRDEQVLYSMRYTNPALNTFIHSFEKVILLPLYPHYSTTTVESLLDELKATKFKGEIAIIPPFYRHTEYNKMIINNIRKSVPDVSQWHLIFSAHGLPQKIVDKGDVYVSQIQDHVKLLSDQLTEFASISLAFQSRVGPVAWVKPYLDDLLRKYEGKNVLVYPLSFVIDNTETDLELAVTYKKIAQKIGVKSFKVVSCPNDSPEFVNFLNQLIEEVDK